MFRDARGHGIELWMIELLSFCTATFRKSLAKVTRPAVAPPLRTSILKTACCTSRPVSLLDTTLWKSSPETSAQHIHTSSIRLMERHKRCTTVEFWHGAQARDAICPSQAHLTTWPVQIARPARRWSRLEVKRTYPRHRWKTGLERPGCH